MEIDTQVKAIREEHYKALEEKSKPYHWTSFKQLTLSNERQTELVEYARE